jgi:hypothetical protein
LIILQGGGQAETGTQMLKQVSEKGSFTKNTGTTEQPILKEVNAGVFLTNEGKPIENITKKLDASQVKAEAIIKPEKQYYMDLKSITEEVINTNGVPKK